MPEKDMESWTPERPITNARNEPIAEAAPGPLVGPSSTLHIATQGGLNSQTRTNTAIQFITLARRRFAKLKGTPVRKMTLTSKVKPKPKRKPMVRKTPSNEVAPVVAPWNTCKKCGEVFPGEPLLAARKLKRHEINKRCNQAEGETVQPLSMCPRSGCKKRFSTKRLLKLHLATRHKKKHEDCELCSWRFSSSVLLKNHYRNVHNVKRFLYCSVCKEPCITEASLVVHRAKQHGHALSWEDKVGEQMTCTPSSSHFNDKDMEGTPQQDFYLDVSQDSGQWIGYSESLRRQLRQQQ